MGKKRDRSKHKSKDESDDESIEEEQKEQQKKRRTEHQASFTNANLVVPDWSKVKQFQRSYWKGPVGVAEPSEELKLLRKDLGVNVKGNLASCPPPVLSIEDANLPSFFRSFFGTHGYMKPTAVQMQAWPAILNGSNVLGVAPTGSGKTLAYTLPIAHLMSSHLEASSSKSTSLRKPLSLILLPTRELVSQVHSVCKALHRILPAMSSGMIYGGQNKEEQLESIVDRGGVNTLIATPGRLIDILQGGSVHNQYTSALLANTQYVVIDEVDRMLALGFREQLEQILSVVRPDRQGIFFTATFPHKLREMVDVWAPDYVLIRCQTINIQDTRKSSNIEAINADADAKEAKDMEEVDQSSANPGVNSTVSTLSSITISPHIEQHIHICAAHKRPRLLLKYLEKVHAQEKDVRQRSGIIIFVNTIKAIKFVQQLLSKQNSEGRSDSKKKDILAVYRLAILHGQLPQQRREEELNAFRSVSMCCDIMAFSFCLMDFLVLG
ncbi:DEAD/DEAH box helicase [archaeon]|nr:MAG: DEAD/DEAH box helicase [archaeon]